MKFIHNTMLLTILILVAGTLQAESIDSRLLQSLGDVKYHELKTAKPERIFHIFVDLPEDYWKSGTSYPAIYLLDGGNTFPLMAAYHHYLRFGDESPPVILVGISYAADTFMEGNYRSTDFTAPSEERDFWGGANDFQAVLRDELLPLIEESYRADPASRVIFGHSLGGQFVLYTALTQPGLFYGHIASNPALHRNLPFFLKWQGKKDAPVNASRLFVASGELEEQRFREPASNWIRHWQAETSRPWILETRILPGQTHLSAVPESFRQGLDWIFSDTRGAEQASH
jgi:predicted alpha/beta superfamily hydrolase